MQVLTIVCVAALVWFSWGYSMAFTSTGSPFPTLFGGLDKAFLKGVDPSTFAATFSNGVYLPEYVFVIFQMTFACITPALIVGAFAERVKFTPLIIFTVLWLTLAYFPLAHMVWYWPGPDFLHAAPKDTGLLWGWGALDFAGGTVVHINAGIAGLVCAIILGKRSGYGKVPMAPHSLVMSMIGASLLWFGWFGFNAGSNLEANGYAVLAFANTMFATAAAAVAWFFKGKPSLLGIISGAIAGLVAITPACGFVGINGGLIIGLVAGVVCFFAVAYLKKILGYDDALDAFGVHAVGGIIGAILTGVFVDPAKGGVGVYNNWVELVPGYSSGQIMIQVKAVLVAIVLSAVVSAVTLLILKYTIGIRVTEEEEAEGLDVSEHGEKAYT
jgi:Amt family ammonium transporter